MKNNKGFSLLDAILWLSIIAIGAITIFSNFKSASDSTKVKTEVDASIVTLNNFRTLISSGGISAAASTDITASVAGMGLVPKVFSATSQTMTNGLGGAIKVFVNTDSLGFRIEFGSLSSQICSVLATSVNDATKVGFSSGTAAILYDKPVPIATISDGCKNATNTVQFYMPK